MKWYDYIFQREKNDIIRAVKTQYGVMTILIMIVFFMIVLIFYMAFMNFALIHIVINKLI